MYPTIDRRNLLYELPDLPINDKVWIAGGAIRDSLMGWKPDDIDIFGVSDAELNAFIEKLQGWEQVYNTDKLKTYRKDGWKIQVIFRTFENRERCIDSFDFTITQFAYNGTDIMLNPEGILHTQRKRLVVHRLNPDFVVDTLRRVQKYAHKGYWICSGGLLEIVTVIRGITDEQVKQNIEFYPDGQPRIVRFD